MEQLHSSYIRNFAIVGHGASGKTSLAEAILMLGGAINRLGTILDRAIKNQIPMVALFPYTSPKLKDDLGSEALNEDNLVCRAIKYIKKRYKNKIGIMCDVALDPYTNHGHDGILKSNNIMNDETIKILVQQSLLQAQMGCDVSVSYTHLTLPTIYSV